MAEIGIERHRAFGEEALHRVGLDVGIVLELVPHRELGGVIGAEREGGDGIEADVAVAVGVEQFRRELAEAQALPDMPFGGAEAGRDCVDRRAASISAAMATNSSAGCIAARIVFSTSEVSIASSGVLDLARDRMVGVDDAFGGELLQDLEAAAAGVDLVDAFAVDRRRMDDEVLQDAFGADAGFERGVLGRRGRSLADIGRGQDELAERRYCGLCCVRSWRETPATGRREPSLALGNPSQIPSRPFSS